MTMAASCPQGGEGVQEPLVQGGFLVVYMSSVLPLTIQVSFQVIKRFQLMWNTGERGENPVLMLLNFSRVDG